MTKIEELERRIAALEARQATTESILHAAGALAFVSLRAAAIDAGIPAAAETFEELLPLLGGRVSQNVAMIEELMDLLQSVAAIADGKTRTGGERALRLVKEHAEP